MIEIADLFYSATNKSASPIELYNLEIPNSTIQATAIGCNEVKDEKEPRINSPISIRPPKKETAIARNRESSNSDVPLLHTSIHSPTTFNTSIVPIKHHLPSSIS